MPNAGAIRLSPMVPVGGARSSLFFGFFLIIAYTLFGQRSGGLTVVDPLLLCRHTVLLLLLGCRLLPHPIAIAVILAHISMSIMNEMH